MRAPPALQAIDQVYRRDARRIFATLVRLLGDFDLAEEGLHDAFRAALEQWPQQGVPENPSAWLVSAGRFKAIDSIRRQARFISTETMVEHVESIVDEAASGDDYLALEDDPLRLIFTYCHPALAADAQVALTLREVCGLTTEEIARAYLTPAPTLAQRIVRAKAKIRDAKIPYRVPEPDELPQRLPSVLRVLYLIFNEGYSPSSGGLVTRADLSHEAIRLTRLIVDVLPPPPLSEIHALLALMLLHESRRAARTGAAGHLIPIEEQDRTRWDAGLIVGLYDELLRMQPTPMVALNRAVAVAMHAGYLCLVYLSKDKRSACAEEACFEAAKGLQMGGHLLEANDLNEAIRLAAKIPPVQHGSVEVRPVRELDVAGFQSFTPPPQGDIHALR